MIALFSGTFFFAATMATRVPFLQKIGHLGFSFLLLFVLFTPLEHFFAVRPGQKVFRAQWWSDAVHFFLNNFITQAIFALGALGVISLIGPWVPTAFRAAVASQPRILQFLEALLLANLGSYCAHRLAHTVPFLWRLHAIHHSVEEMDWLAAARLHPLDQGIERTFTIIPLFICGFTKETLGGYIVFAAIQAIFIHANIRLNLGPLKWVIGTPEFHHWHHSNHPEAYNKNFAGGMPFLDWVFGTLHLPKNEHPSRYGLDEPIPKTWWKQMTWPFQRTKHR